MSLDRALNKASGRLSETAGNTLGKAAERLVRSMTKDFTVEGKEYVPAGGCLVISNHASHFDGHSLIAALAGENIGFAVHEEAEALQPFKGAARMAGITRLRPRVSHLPEDDIASLSPDSLLGRAASREKEPIKRGADVLSNVAALIGLVDDIIKGKKVVFLPEGAFFKPDDKRLRQVTKGVKAISRIYKERTGKDLSILPAGVEGGETVMGADPDSWSPKDMLRAMREKSGVVKVRFGEPFTISDGDDFDKVFKEKVGVLLPDAYHAD